MEDPEDKYASFVEHPRFGKRPRPTGLSPAASDPAVHLHWRSGRVRRIPGTAIQADLTRQTPGTYPVTHYFDEEEVCRDCARPFIFFAEEQKYWYEVLGFGLESDCVRCPRCRKQEQKAVRLHKRYMELCQLSERTPEEQLELADCRLTLIERRELHSRHLPRVLEALNRVPAERRSEPVFTRLLERLQAVELQVAQRGTAATGEAEDR